ncbi:MAG: tetratricopeptide repeat protein [Thermodesulfovibrionales bacterium]|nr:tetratricopeptide repeat protein [Thermodesulfovibrionales bacterium]
MNIIILLFSMFILILSYNSGYAWEEELKKGIENYRAENYEEAFEYLFQARQKNRSSSMVAFYLGLTFKQTGEYEKAAEYFQDAIELKPPVIEAYGELIEMLYSLDKTKEALDYISKAEALKIQPAKISFLKGLVYMKMNENEKAIASFDKAKKEDPSITQAVDLQIAIAYTRQRKTSLAMRSLKAVIEANPDSELGRFARDYEKAISRSIEGYKPVRLSIGVSYVYDTNVTAQPSTDVGLPPSDKKDSAITGNFGISFNPLTEGDLIFSAQYNISGTFYKKITDYNAIAQNISITPGYSLKNGSITLPISYAYNLLNEKGYMATLTVKPTLNYVLLPGQISYVFLSYANRNMIQKALDPDEERDSNLVSGGVGYMYPFAEGKGLLNLKYEYIMDNTKGVNWKNRGSKFNASLIAPIKEKIDVIFSVEAYLQNYKNENTIFGIKRKDDNYTINGGFSWEFVRNLYANGQIVYSKVKSNIPLYDYNKTVFMAGIEYRF